MNNRRRLYAPIVLLLSLIAAPAAWAQQQTGRIDGVVTDATGGVVPGATVLLTGANTGQLETTSTANGWMPRAAP